VPPDTEERPRRDNQGRSHTTTAPAQRTSAVIISERTPGTRPLCRVVGTYCEALYWLRGEPLSRATVCCRHYWGEREAS